MKAQSYLTPLDRALGRNTEAYAMKARKRQHVDEDLRRKKQLEHIQQRMNQEAPTSPLRTKHQKFEDAFKERVFDERHIFVLVDG